MSETPFSSRHRYEEGYIHKTKPYKPCYGWTFKFLKKRYRVYMFDDMFSISPFNGGMMQRLFIVKLSKTKQIVMRDIINLFEPTGKPTKDMRSIVRKHMVYHLKQHLGL